MGIACYSQNLFFFVCFFKGNIPRVINHYSLGILRQSHITRDNQSPVGRLLSKNSWAVRALWLQHHAYCEEKKFEIMCCMIQKCELVPMNFNQQKNTKLFVVDMMNFILKDFKDPSSPGCIVCKKFTVDRQVSDITMLLHENWFQLNFGVH